MDDSNASSEPAKELAEARGPFTSLGLAAYLFGSRRAIRAALECRGLIWVAVFLALSAGFAREYDGEYLVAEPWYLLAPLGVALAMGSVLFTVLLACTWRSRPTCISIRKLWVAFLTCYLLLSPTAWLYAIPYERWYDELGATRLNLMTLSAVSAWRVLVIARVAGVMFNRSMLATLFPVLLFASSAVVVGLLGQIRLPEIMAGVRLSEVEQLVQAFTGGWVNMALTTLIVWLVGSVIVSFKAEAISRVAWPAGGNALPSAALLCLSIAALIVWIPILPGPQREQRNRYEVERLFACGEIDAALHEFESRAQSDFPPLWKPPPLGYRTVGDSSLVQTLNHFTASTPPHWVRQMYFDKLRSWVSTRAGYYMIRQEDWVTLAAVLRRLPEGRELALACDPDVLLSFRDGRFAEPIRTAAQEILDLGRAEVNEPETQPGDGG